ncbi:MAG: DoxX family protein [Marinomonas sp.]
MSSVISLYDRIVALLSGRFFEGLALLAARVALAGIFWRSYKNKVVEGTWFDIDPFTYELFENEFSGLPLASSIAVPITTYAEFVLPILVFLGLGTRFGALGLLVITAVIQIFVFPTSAHLFGWAITTGALALILIGRGGGIFSADQIADIARAR